MSLESYTFDQTQWSDMGSIYSNSKENEAEINFCKEFMSTIATCTGCLKLIADHDLEEAVGGFDNPTNDKYFPLKVCKTCLDSNRKQFIFCKKCTD